MGRRANRALVAHFGAGGRLGSQARPSDLMDHMQNGAKFKTSSPYAFNSKVGNWITQGVQGVTCYLLVCNGPLNNGGSSRAHITKLVAHERNRTSWKGSQQTPILS